MPFAVETHLRTFERHGEATAVVVAVVRFGEANTAFGSSVAGLWQRDFAPLAVPCASLAVPAGSVAVALQ